MVGTILLPPSRVFFSVALSPRLRGCAAHVLPCALVATGSPGIVEARFLDFRTSTLLSGSVPCCASSENGRYTFVPSKALKESLGNAMQVTCFVSVAFHLVLMIDCILSQKVSVQWRLYELCVLMMLKHAASYELAHSIVVTRSWSRDGHISHAVATFSSGVARPETHLS